MTDLVDHLIAGVIIGLVVATLALLVVAVAA